MEGWEPLVLIMCLSVKGKWEKNAVNLLKLKDFSKAVFRTYPINLSIPEVFHKSFNPGTYLLVWKCQKLLRNLKPKFLLKFFEEYVSHFGFLVTHFGICCYPLRGFRGFRGTFPVKGVFSPISPCLGNNWFD